MRFWPKLVLFLLPSLAFSAVPIDGWYGSVFGGYAYLPDNIRILQPGAMRTNADYQSGFNAGGNVGYKSNPMRYEGELTYFQADLNRFYVNNLPQIGVTGYNNGILAMANVYYDFLSPVEPLQPFLGVGIGYAFIQAKLNSTGSFGATTYSEHDSVFAYQGTAGLTYNFAENYALSLSYRYLATTNVPCLGKIFQANFANVGATYRFDGDRYK
jgi:opacity protein-like surface antigen